MFSWRGNLRAVRLRESAVSQGRMGGNTRSSLWSWPSLHKQEQSLSHMKQVQTGFTEKLCIPLGGVQKENSSANIFPSLVSHWTELTHGVLTTFYFWNASLGPSREPDCMPCSMLLHLSLELVIVAVVETEQIPRADWQVRLRGSEAVRKMCLV